MDSEIIDSRLIFYGFEHFFNRRFIIKTIFSLKDKKDQNIYRWYVYSRPFMNDNHKNYIWDYLQGDIGELEILTIHAKMKKHI